MSLPDVSVVIPAHNPHRGRLEEVLGALRGQTLHPSAWETLLVDNASSDFPQASGLASVAPPNLRVLREDELGLTAARLHGIRSARGAVVVLVDDDNVLAPDYLSEAARLFARDPRLGAAGGRSLPAFETPPATWHREFLPLLALRDLGESELVATTMRPDGAPAPQYPPFRRSAPAWPCGARRPRDGRRRWGATREGAPLTAGGPGLSPAATTTS